MFPAFVLFTLTGIGPARAVKHGIVGFGITLYPDICCQACNAALSSLSLNCTTFDDPSMAEMGTTTPACRGSNRPWLESMAYCIRTHCESDGLSESQQDECFTTYSLVATNETSLEGNLPAVPPTEILPGTATWLNSTSLANQETYQATYQTLEEFSRQENLHARFAVALYLVVITVLIILGGISQSLARVSASVYRNITTSNLEKNLNGKLLLPALFDSQRRLEPLPGKIGYLPSRGMTILVTLYVILNVIFCSVSFRSVQPNTWFFSRQFELCEYIGNRTGVLSFANMGIAILLAGRNTSLVKWTGWSPTAFIILHRWTARIAVVQALVHSVLYTAAWWAEGYGGAEMYAEKVGEAYFWWGIIATVAICLAAAFAALPFRIRFYETFLVLHILLVILALVGCWYHIVLHFDFDFGYEVWLYLCFAFWAADRAARLGRVLYYNGLSGSRAILEPISGCDIVQVTVFPRSMRGFGPATHSFLYLRSVRFWESHPFSVAAWTATSLSTPKSAEHKTDHAVAADDEKGVIVHHLDAETNTPTPNTANAPTIKFMIRPRKGMTRHIQTYLRSSTGPSLPKEIRVYTEGPYSGHRATLTPLYAADTILCVAGGIGITHILGFLQGINTTTGEKGRKFRAERIMLAWSAREGALMDHVKREFLGDFRGECLFFCTGKITDQEAHGHESSGQQGLSDARKGRMNIAEVLRGAVGKTHHTAVLVCAPGAMADEVTREVVKCVGEGFRVDLVEEAFAW